MEDKELYPLSVFCGNCCNFIEAQTWFSMEQNYADIETLKICKVYIYFCNVECMKGFMSPSRFSCVCPTCMCYYRKNKF